MKRDSVCLNFTGAVLGFGISLGAVGCFATAFDLPIPHMLMTAGILCAVCLICAAVHLLRRSGLVTIILLAAAALVIWQKTDVFPQVQALLHRITTIYHRAYGWPVLFPDADGAVEIPLMIWGSLCAVVVVHTVCRGNGLGETALMVLLPLFSCVVVTDTVPEERWLFCLMAAFSLLVLTSSVRRENGSQSVRLTATMMIPVVLALAVLFWTTPRDGYVNHPESLRQSILIRLQSIPEQLEMKLNQVMEQLPRKESRQVNLSTLGARVILRYPVMDITCDKSGRIYLRYQDFDRYDGRAWISTENRQETYPSPEGSLWTASIHTRSPHTVLFLPGYPRDRMTLTDGMADNPEKLTEYTISCRSLPENWRATAYGPASMGGEYPQYLDLPEKTLQSARAILADLYDPDAGNTEKADAIAALVASSAVYDLTPGIMPQDQEDFAFWFLEEADRGYCVHFATAATVLLRAAGVPARYVSGYLAEVTAGQTLTVTEEDAHAWAEYYEPSLNCWLVLESTPGEVTAPPTESTVPTIGSTEPAQTEAPTTTEAELPRETEGIPPLRYEEDPVSPPEEPERIPGWVWIPASVLAAALVLALQRYCRLRFRHNSFRRGSPNQQALRRWQEVERLSRLRKETPPEELLSLARKARFSQHTLTQEELQAFDNHLRLCRREMEKQSLPRRLIHKYIHAAF